PLLPATIAVDDAFYFGMQGPGRILVLNIDVAGDWEGTIVWEYWNDEGSLWDPLEDVTDSSNGFRNEGFRSVTFTQPYNWGKTTVDSNESWWIRARVSAVTNTFVQPEATQGWWETGLWWTLVDSIAQNEQINYTLYLGGSTDFVTNHQIF